MRNGPQEYPDGGTVLGGDALLRPKGQHPLAREALTFEPPSMTQYGAGRLVFYVAADPAAAQRAQGRLTEYIDTEELSGFAGYDIGYQDRLVYMVGGVSDGQYVNECLVMRGFEPLPPEVLPSEASPQFSNDPREAEVQRIVQDFAQDIADSNGAGACNLVVSPLRQRCQADPQGFAGPVSGPLTFQRTDVGEPNLEASSITVRNEEGATATVSLTPIGSTDLIQNITDD
jgi:hypothetical protein